MSRSDFSRSDSGGAMTGATGDLTPDGSDVAFMPSELRAMIRPVAPPIERRRHWPTDEADHLQPAYMQQMDAEQDAKSQRDFGHDAPRGLVADEPSYQLTQMEKRPVGTSRYRSAGGDIYSRPEDDRF